MPDQATIELTDDERTPCEVWTRVMGYHRPVSAFNPGKQAEHADRRYFSETPREKSHADERSHSPLGRA